MSIVLAVLAVSTLIAFGLGLVTAKPARLRIAKRAGRRG